VQAGVGAFRDGRLADAIRELRQARDLLRTLSIAYPSDYRALKLLAPSILCLGSALRDAQRPVEALASFQEARTVLERMRNPGPGQLYDLACCYAQIKMLVEHAPNPPSSSEREGLALRAVETLRRAQAEGYDLRAMEQNHDLEPLRGRADFRGLILDRDFPSDPFAGPSPIRFAATRPLGVELARLSDELARKPAAFGSWLARGQFFANHNEWSSARSDFRKVLELHPPDQWLDDDLDTWHGFQAGVLFLQAGDREAHRQIARGMLDRYAASNQASTLERVTKLNLFVAPAATDMNQLDTMTAKLLNQSPNNSYYLLNRGMWLFRSGDNEAALKVLRQAERGLDGLAEIEIQFYMAIAHYRRGEAELSLDLYRAASRQLESATNREDWGADWFGVAETDLIRREAQALLARPTPRALVPSKQISNGSFEYPPCIGVRELAGIAGWTGSRDDHAFGVSRESELLPKIPKGLQAAYINNFPTGQGKSTRHAIAQQLTEALQINTTYELSAHFGWRNDNPESTGGLELWAGGEATDGEIVGGTRLASKAVVLEKGKFVLGTVSYLATQNDPHLGKRLSVRLTGTPKEANGFAQTNFDQVTFKATQSPGPVARP
jgi:tetratricopeptide (TPR) repeat protein